MSVTHTIVIICRKQFLIKYRFPFPILRFISLNHLALLKDRFFQENAFKKSKNWRPFSQICRLK